MLHSWQRFTAKIRRAFEIAVMFCIVRFVVGIAAIALFDRGAVAWGPELTIVVLATVAVLGAIAIALRRVSSGDAESSDALS